MIRRISIGVAAAGLVLALSAPADARHGGGFGGFRGAGFHGGGFRGGGFHAGGFRVGGFHGGPRFYGGGPRFSGGGFHRPHHHRPYWRRPFIGAGVIGGGYYGSCWRWRLTPWGWRRVFVCGYRPW